MTAWLSLMGIAQTYPDVLSAIHYPPSINKDDMDALLLMETSELSLIITDPEILKIKLQIWSKFRNPIWGKLIKTTEYEYNPIHNYDRTEEEKLKEKRKSNRVERPNNQAVRVDEKGLSAQNVSETRE